MSSYNKTNPESIQQMFGSIAKHYDRTNAILSFQLHKWWNSRLIKAIANKKKKGPLLDVCSGTGDIALGYLRKATEKSQVFLLDFSEEMLHFARMKAKQMKLDEHDIIYMKADAQAIPLPDHHVSCATVAYGIRNVQDPRKCAEEVYRVLEPRGIFGILELTRPDYPILRFGHSFYLNRILPFIGKLTTSNEEAYHYLCNSIQNFISSSKLKEILFSAGFETVDVTPLCGGIATIYIALKGGYNGID